MTETQGKTEIDNINQDKEQTQPTNLQSPKAGTATSSPTFKQRPTQINCLQRYGQQTESSEVAMKRLLEEPTIKVKAAFSPVLTEYVVVGFPYLLREPVQPVNIICWRLA